MLESIARFCFRKKWLVLLLWLLILGATIFFSTTQGGKFRNNFSLPGTESQKTFALLEESFPSQSGDTGQIVFKAEDGIQSVRTRMEAGFAAAQKASKHVLFVSSPYAPEGARQVAAQGPDAGKIAFGEIQFDLQASALPEELSKDLQEAVRKAIKPGDGLQVEFGGQPFQEIAPPGGREEKIGLAAAVVILLLAFGSVLAMGLSMFTALFSLGISLSGLAILARVMDVATFSPLIAAMIGLGVGIDYALFIVTRYRQGLRDGKTPEAAAVTSITTAGRAVLFAGITVIISLLGMFLMNLSFVNGLAVGAGLAVLVTMLASVTLLPALMGIVGSKIDKLSIHFRSQKKPAKPKEAAFWYRWSRSVQRHPVPMVLISLVILGTLAAPVFSIRLGNSDAGNGPTALTTRRAYDLLSAAFGPGYNGPLIVAANFKAPESFAQIQALQTRLAADPGVANVSPVIPNDPQKPSAAIIQVYGKFAPQDVRTDELVKRLRKDVIAPLAERTGIVIYSGGPAAIGLDLTDKLTERLPIFFGGVILLSFLLLMAAFRSILVPLKAALMNVLAIGAAFGVLVAVFQWGWGAELIGVDRTGPIAAFSPMILFAILFGLSMDYEVFLLSRIKEEHEKTGNNALAVADGLASTARVITAAAAIMVTVFFSFVLGDEPNAKLVGLGLAVSIFLDATLVRMVLVPATMELLGEANWYLPKWLDRIIPKINIEADRDELPAGVPEFPPFHAGAPASATEQIQDEDALVRTRSVTGIGIPQLSYPTVPTTAHVPGVNAARWITSGPEDLGNPELVPRVDPPPAPVARSGGITVPRPAALPLPYRFAPQGGTGGDDNGPAPSESTGGSTAGGDLHKILWDLPFKAGEGTVQENLEELLSAAMVLHQSGAPQELEVSRITGYLELEQRFGRVRQSTELSAAAQLLMGALAAPARSTNGDSRQVAAEAVRIVLEGIKA